KDKIFGELLDNIKKMMLERPDVKQPKVFISYAWEVDDRANAQLQSRLKQLRDDLQRSGAEVFLDVGDMTDQIKRQMQDNINISNVLIFICTPRFKERLIFNDKGEPLTNLAFEFQTAMNKAKTKTSSPPLMILPLHYSGEKFQDAVPDELAGFLVRDFREANTYQERLVALQGPLGIIPAIYGVSFKNKDGGYSSLLWRWQWQRLVLLRPKNLKFVGRQTALEQLATVFQQQEGRGTSQWQAITGLAGVGKTQLALAFAHAHVSQYTMVRWLNAEGDNLKREFVEIATKLGIETKDVNILELVATVHHELAEIPSWLLVIDNADNYESVKAYLPKRTKVGQHVLITSRSQQWEEERMVKINPFSPEEAFMYVQKRIPKVIFDDAQALMKEVGFLPLALNFAVAYIEQMKISIPSYLKIYQEKGIEFLQPGGLGDKEYPNSVSTTLAISMDKVNNRSSQAVELLRMCAYLAPDDIPRELFTQSELFEEAHAVNEALAVLFDYSLMEPAKLTDHIQVHRLVQMVMHQRILQTDSIEQQAKRLVALQKVLMTYYPWKKKKLSDYEVARLLLPHVNTVIQYLTTWENGTSNELFVVALAQAKLLKLAASIGETLGDTRNHKMLLERALPIFERHLAIQEQQYGSMHFELASTLVSLGDLLKELGKMTKAKECFERVLEIQENQYGHKHLELVSALENLGYVLGELGNGVKSKEYHESALAIKEQHYGSEHFKIASTLLNVGVALFELNEAADAKKYFERALAIQEQHYGPKWPNIANTLMNLGNAWYHLDNAVKAKEYHERALAIQEQHYGRESSKLARVLYNISFAEEKLGQMDKALLSVGQVQTLLSQSTSYEEYTMHTNCQRRMKQLETLKNERPLHWAAASGQYKEVLSLLQQGLRIEELNQNSYTSLHLAARYGHEAVVKLLVAWGADVHARNPHDFVLHQAVRSNNPAIVNLLLDKGANINVVDNEGDAPLEWASEEGDKGIGMMQLLLRKGAHINHANHYGVTALHVCAQNGEKAAVVFLLAQGANYRLMNHEGKTPAKLAQEAGRQEVYELLAQAEQAETKKPEINRQPGEQSLTTAPRTQPVLTGHPATLFGGNAAASPAQPSSQSKGELKQAEATLTPY
ncbi:MAG: FxSxx-COOH system tetratricopeptide repeat protein, partial [Gammaproteobacteria bacterium]